MTSKKPQTSPSKKSPQKPLLFLWQSIKVYPWDILKSLIAVIVTSGAILAVGYGLRTLVDKGFSAENTDLLNQSALILVGLAMVIAASAYLRTSTTAWLSEKITNDLRQKLFHHILHLNIETFNSIKLGDLLSRLNTDCDQIRIFISGSAAVAVRTIFQLIGGTTLLIISSPTLTLYVFAIIPFVLIPISVFGRKVKLLTHQAQTLEGDALSLAEEHLSALTMLKSFTAESQSDQLFRDLQNKKLKVVKKRTHYRALLVSLVIALVFSAIAGILWMGGKEVIQDKITTGQLSAFVFYVIIVAGAMNSLAEIISTFNLTLGATSRLTELLEEPLETQLQTITEPKILKDFQSLSLEEVSFSYPARPDVEVLDKISLTLKQGQKIALVGPSGVGKSTLFKLLLRFYRQNHGSLLLNDHPLDHYTLKSTRQLFTFVPQDPLIFNTSILNNIAIANPKAPLEEILCAAKKAYIDEFADKFPEGYHTKLGNKGVKLSGGQKQRIALARALLKDAPIFLLDEATNALDSQSEQHIQHALHAVLKNKSAIIIAHRLSTVKEVDQIIVLNDKRIEALGTHAELMATSPLYKTLAQQQFLDL